MVKAIIELLKLKSLMSLAVIFTTCYLTMKGVIDIASFMVIAGSIITYYFTKKDKEKNEEV